MLPTTGDRRGSKIRVPANRIEERGFLPNFRSTGRAARSFVVHRSGRIPDLESTASPRPRPSTRRASMFWELGFLSARSPERMAGNQLVVQRGLGERDDPVQGAGNRGRRSGTESVVPIVLYIYFNPAPNRVGSTFIRDCAEVRGGWSVGVGIFRRGVRTNYEALMAASGLCPILPHRADNPAGKDRADYSPGRGDSSTMSAEGVTGMQAKVSDTIGEMRRRGSDPTWTFPCRGLWAFPTRDQARAMRASRASDSSPAAPSSNRIATLGSVAGPCSGRFSAFAASAFPKPSN